MIDIQEVELSVIPTSPGKTFTITGGAERYKDRGMIPRSIGHLFQLFEKVRSQGQRSPRSRACFLANMR